MFRGFDIIWMLFLLNHRPGKCLHRKHGQPFKSVSLCVWKVLKNRNGSEYRINSLVCIFWAIPVLFAERLKDKKDISINLSTSGGCWNQNSTVTSLCDWSNQAPSCNVVDMLLIWTVSPVMRACVKDMKFRSLWFRGWNVHSLIAFPSQIATRGRGKKKKKKTLKWWKKTHTYLVFFVIQWVGHIIQLESEI